MKGFFEDRSNYKRRFNDKEMRYYSLGILKSVLFFFLLFRDEDFKGKLDYSRKNYICFEYLNVVIM